METDKFSDFYYVETKKQEINKIHVELIEQAFDGPIDLTPEFLYGANSTETMLAPLGLTIEREYLYWTNTN